jgi:hypothetical protein
MAILRLDPKTKQVQRDEATFLGLIGECVSLWAFMDRELFNLTRACLGTDDKLTAIVFYSWTNIASHLMLVDRLMKHALSSDHFTKKWRPLQKRIKHHLNTRSIYAHQPIKRTGTGKYNRAFYFYSIHIEPAEQLLERKYEGLAGKTELLAKDLRKHAMSLEKLVKEVSAFRTLIPSVGTTPRGPAMRRG